AKSSVRRADLRARLLTSWRDFSGSSSGGRKQRRPARPRRPPPLPPSEDAASPSALVAGAAGVHLRGDARAVRPRLRLQHRRGGSDAPGAGGGPPRTHGSASPAWCPAEPPKAAWLLATRCFGRQPASTSPVSPTQRLLEALKLAGSAPAPPGAAGTRANPAAAGRWRRPVGAAGLGDLRRASAGDSRAAEQDGQGPRLQHCRRNAQRAPARRQRHLHHEGLIEGGAAQLDGRIAVGDRLVSPPEQLAVLIGMEEEAEEAAAARLLRSPQSAIQQQQEQQQQQLLPTDHYALEFATCLKAKYFAVLSAVARSTPIETGCPGPMQTRDSTNFGIRDCLVRVETRGTVEHADPVPNRLLGVVGGGASRGPRSQRQSWCHFDSPKILVTECKRSPVDQVKSLPPSRQRQSGLRSSHSGVSAAFSTCLSEPCLNLEAMESLKVR
uniref:Os05g0551100 protein n=1 Tax=Macrostomum lignano TaxID=282301 RepID=A0A1I8JQ89_9PLAT